MPRNSKRSNKRRNKIAKTKKNNYSMIGCAKKNKHSKSCYNISKKNNKTLFSSLGKNSCPICGPNCHCGPNCNCQHKCPGKCYLNRTLKGGSGCGSCGCPIAPLSWNQMNQFGGYVKDGPTGYPPVIGSGQNGGMCGVCSQVPVQSGGNFFKPPVPVPGPFVGQAWGTNINEWPGVDGVGANRNFLSTINKVIDNDPALQMNTSDVDAGYKTLSSMVGGYVYDTPKKTKAKRKTNSKTTSKSGSKTSTTSSLSRSSSSIKGGSLIPQDLLNLGSDITYNMKSAYNALNGYSAPVNPLPYKDQLIKPK
jgi:hypothetical protein